jgi:hypothetical protein
MHADNRFARKATCICSSASNRRDFNARRSARMPPMPLRLS